MKQPAAMLSSSSMGLQKIMDSSSARTVEKPSLSLTRAEILKRAESAVNGDRDLQYGNPEDNFGRIAALWEAYYGALFSRADVAIMLGLVKIARLRANPQSVDSWVDLAGYAACGGEVAEIGEEELD